MDPIVLAAGDGERAGSSASVSCFIKATLPEVTLVEFTWPANRAGPEFHVHHEHADAFYVLAGHLTMTVGPDREELRLDKGDFVMVPPDVAHTFRNDDAIQPRFLNIHAPDKGYAESLRGRREGFDQHPAPEDGGLPVTGVVIRRAGGDDVKASLRDGAGALAVTELTVSSEAAESDGSPAPLMLFVVDGSVRLRMGAQEHEIEPCGFALVPPGTAHAIRSAGDEPARVLELTVPAN